MASRRDDGEGKGNNTVRRSARLSMKSGDVADANKRPTQEAGELSEDNGTEDQKPNPRRSLRRRRKAQKVIDQQPEMRAPQLSLSGDLAQDAEEGDMDMDMQDANVRGSTRDKGKGIMIDHGNNNNEQMQDGNIVVSSRATRDKGKGIVREKGKGLANDQAVVETDTELGIDGGGPSSSTVRKAQVQIMISENDSAEDNVAEDNGNDARPGGRVSRAKFLQIARNRAQHFAFFEGETDNLQVSSSRQRSSTRVEKEEERDWPGPFSTARRLVQERAGALAKLQEKQRLGTRTADSEIKWEPSETSVGKKFRQPASLYDLCLDILTKHAEYIESLEGIPDSTRSKMCKSFCTNRKMDPRILGLFMAGSPSEVRVSDCSFIPEEDLSRLLIEHSTSKLEALHLDYCGRAVSDRLLQLTAFDLHSLLSLSLKGAYRLTDEGLKALIEKAPLLTSVDFSHCSLITEKSIDILAEKLGQMITELRIEACRQLEPSKILPALKKMQCLKILSLSENPDVTDGFVRELLAYQGCNLKEIYLADCNKLTDSSLEAIGAVCCSLTTLNIDYLSQLTDMSLVYLSIGCKYIQKLSCKRCSFSDEAVAAFMKDSGNCLSDISLNNVKEVSNQTILALINSSRNTLMKLDLSWCRNLTDEALGLLVDSCSSLRELIIFGCAQITDKFLKGHSNSLLKIQQ